jgi:hypothetical protein
MCWTSVRCLLKYNNIIDKKVPKGYAIISGGGIEANAEAERFSDVDTAVDDNELSCGKCKHKPNGRYNTSSFWWHNDDSDSVNDI